jgi:DNA-binding GntR family transcriptional regulator
MVSLRELVVRLGTPLAALREALSRLEGERLVRVYAQRGIQVAPVDMAFMREAFQLRRILECEGVRALVDLGEPDTLDDLARRFDALRAAASEGLTAAVRAEAVAADRALHDAIIGALNSATIHDLYTQIRERLQLVRSAAGLPPGGMILAATEEHLAILVTLQRRDHLGARAALGAHLDAAMRRQIGMR